MKKIITLLALTSLNLSAHDEPKLILEYQYVNSKKMIPSLRLVFTVKQITMTSYILSSLGTQAECYFIIYPCVPFDVLDSCNCIVYLRLLSNM